MVLPEESRCASEHIFVFIRNTDEHDRIFKRIKRINNSADIKTCCFSGYMIDIKWINIF